MKNNKNNGFVKNSFIYILMIIVVITGFQFYLKGTSTQSQQISYSKLIKHLKAGDIKSLSYQPSGSIIEVKGKYEKAQKVSVDPGLSFLGGDASAQVTEFSSLVLPSDSILKEMTSAADKNGTEITVKQESSSGTWITFLMSFLPIVIFAAFMMMMMNQGGGGARGAMSFGKNKAKSQSKGDVKVRFTDVAGAEEEKQELVEVVDFLKNPKK
ncbi:cell division protein FtsH, partial [Streptococcus pyogenes]